MNEIIARAARLLQNPESVKDLQKSLTDPQALTRLAGLGPGVFSDDKLKLLSGIGSTVSGLLKNITKSPGKSASAVRIPKPSPPAPNPGARSTSVNSTAIAGTVSLTAITGAVVAVGTVSAVGLARSRRAR